MTAQRPDRSEFAGLRPPGHRLRIDPESRRHFRGGQKRIHRMCRLACRHFHPLLHCTVLIAGSPNSRLALEQDGGRLTGSPMRLLICCRVVIPSDCGNWYAQGVSYPVNRRRAGTSLFPLDIRKRSLAHADLPGEFRLMPAIFFAKRPDCCAVLAKPAWCPPRVARCNGDRLCPAHGDNLGSWRNTRNTNEHTDGH